jgi:chemotaxis signal transduction protein
MATLDDNNSLLLFRVGPVYCCVPSLPVDSVITPPKLTRPPGSSISRPGIFKFGPRMVSVMDLRYLFGVEKQHWKPGRNIIATINNRSFGFWVDDILDVLEMPTKGWGTIPALISHDVFSRTLLLDDNIYLYTEAENLIKLKNPGLLKKYIEQLNKQQQIKSDTHSTINKNLGSSSKLSSSNKSEVKKVLSSIHGDPVSLEPDIVSSTLTATPNQDEPTDLNGNRQTKTDLLTNKYITEEKHSNTTQTHETTSQTTSINKQRHAGKTDTSSILNSDHEERKKFIHSDKPSQPLPDITLSPENKIKINHPIERTILQQPAPVPRPLNNPDKNNTTSQVASEKNDNAPSWLFIMAFLLILGSAGYFAYDLYYPDKQQPGPLAKTRHNSENTPPPVPLDTVDEPVIEIPATDEPNTNPTIQIENTSRDENFNNSKNMTIPKVTKNKDAIKLSVKPVIAKKDSNHSSLQQQSAYHAEIAREGNEITIILHESEQTILKTESEIKTSAVGEEKAPQTQHINKEQSQSETFIKIDLFKNAEALKIQPHIKDEKKPIVIKTEIVHLVVRGDTLWAIAKRYVNNPYRYPELARLSKIRNPDLIYPGNRVRIIKYEISHPD